MPMLDMPLQELQTYLETNPCPRVGTGGFSGAQCRLL